MVFGGSLNSDGTDYLRELRKIENVISFLEELKANVEELEKQKIEDTIDILMKYGNKLAEKQKNGG
jgi:hypothetical protein